MHGAERKIFNSENSIFINHPETGEMKFDSSQFSQVQRILVNLNTIPLFYPGGKLTSQNKFVHIFNWDAFLRLVLELNTIPDLIGYLIEREEVFRKREILMLTGKENDWDESTHQNFLKYTSSLGQSEKDFILISGNELDLLADYYFNERKFNMHMYSTRYNGAIMELDGLWDKYLCRKEVQKKKEDDRVSYFVDEFVKREVLYRKDAQNIELATELLSLSRFERRIIGKQFFEFADRYKNENENFVARRYGVINEFVIAFLIHGHTMPHEAILTAMDIAIKGYCYWEGYKTKKIILIANSNKLNQFKYGYLKDIEPFSKDDEEKIAQDLKRLNWFQNIEEIHFSIDEYPD